MMSNEKIIQQLMAGHDLDCMEMKTLIERILNGDMEPVQIAASLVLLQAKRPSAQEISVAAQTILKKALPIARPDYLYADIVGTGGDGHNTINVSTLASLTAAAAGLPVAKHGNVSVSSRCGSADILRELGVDILQTPEVALKSLQEKQWCFLFAPQYHPAFKSVKEIRSQLKVKTIFNVIGPLVNPLTPPIMVIGVYEPQLIELFAQAVKQLGHKRVLIVHGSGLDEIALHGPTQAALVDDTSIERMTFHPKDFGLTPASLAEVQGQDAAHNALLCREILLGKSSVALTEMIAASAGALLWLSQKASSLKEGASIANELLRQQQVLKTLKKITESRYGT